MKDEIEIIEDDNQINNDVEILENVPVSKNNKKSNKIIIILVLVTLLIAGLFGYYLYNKYFIESNNNATDKIKLKENEENNINNSDVSKGELEFISKKEILSIIGLTENGYSRMDNKSINEYELIGTDYIDFNILDIARVFIDLKSGEYTTSNLDIYSINTILYGYAKDNLIEMKYIDAGDDINHPCINGSGYCYGFNEENYNKVIKVYNLNNNVLPKHDNYYLLNNYPTGTLDNPHKIKDNISFSYQNNEVLVTYNISLEPIDGNNNGSTFNKTIIYSFKKYENGSYYLSKFIVKEN